MSENAIDSESISTPGTDAAKPRALTARPKPDMKNGRSKVTAPLLGRARANPHHSQEFAPPVGRIHFCRPPPTISSFCLTPSGGPYIFC